MGFFEKGMSLRSNVSITTGAQRKILGIAKKWFIIGAVALACLLILIVGLAAGLSKKHSKSSTFLPLPTSSQTFTGDATWYGTGLGACGITSSPNDHIIAVSHLLWDSQSKSSNPNENPLCGLKVRATRYKANNELWTIGQSTENTPGGKNVSVDVTVVDRCVGCAATDLDFSLSAFDILTSEPMGRVTMEWAWLTSN